MRYFLEAPLLVEMLNGSSKSGVFRTIGNVLGSTPTDSVVLLLGDENGVLLYTEVAAAHIKCQTENPTFSGRAICRESALLPKKLRHINSIV